MSYPAVCEDVPIPMADDVDDLSPGMFDRSLLRCKSIILSERQRLSFITFLILSEKESVTKCLYIMLHKICV